MQFRAYSDIKTRFKRLVRRATQLVACGEVIFNGGLEFSLNPVASFNLISFDLAGIVNGARPTVEVVGYELQIMAPTLMVTNYITVTSDNFQTFYLSSGFQNVYEVEILNAPFSLDNMVISGVPEPSCGALVVLATLCGLGRAWMRGKRTE